MFYVSVIIEFCANQVRAETTADIHPVEDAYPFDLEGFGIFEIESADQVAPHMTDDQTCLGMERYHTQFGEFSQQADVIDRIAGLDGSKDLLLSCSKDVEGKFFHSLHGCDLGNGPDRIVLEMPQGN